MKSFTRYGLFVTLSCISIYNDFPLLLTIYLGRMHLPANNQEPVSPSNLDHGYLPDGLAEGSCKHFGCWRFSLNGFHGVLKISPHIARVKEVSAAQVVKANGIWCILLHHCICTYQLHQALLLLLVKDKIYWAAPSISISFGWSRLDLPVNPFIIVARRGANRSLANLQPAIHGIEALEDPCIITQVFLPQHLVLQSKNTRQGNSITAMQCNSASWT